MVRQPSVVMREDVPEKGGRGHWTMYNAEKRQALENTDNRPWNTSTFTTAEKLDGVSRNTSLLLSIGARLPSPRKLRQKLQNTTLSSWGWGGDHSEAQTWMKLFISNLNDTVYQNLHITEVKNKVASCCLSQGSQSFPQYNHLGQLRLPQCTLGTEAG